MPRGAIGDDDSANSWASVGAGRAPGPVCSPFHSDSLLRSSTYSFLNIQFMERRKRESVKLLLTDRRMT